MAHVAGSMLTTRHIPHKFLPDPRGPQNPANPKGEPRADCRSFAAAAIGRRRHRRCSRPGLLADRLRPQRKAVRAVQEPQPAGRSSPPRRLNFLPVPRAKWPAARLRRRRRLDPPLRRCPGVLAGVLAGKRAACLVCGHDGGELQTPRNGHHRPFRALLSNY